jgi:hypothetical protein
MHRRTESSANNEAIGFGHHPDPFAKHYERAIMDFCK